jgi:hypothetical protein
MAEAIAVFGTVAAGAQVGSQLLDLFSDVKRFYNDLKNASEKHPEMLNGFQQVFRVSTS